MRELNIKEMEETAGGSFRPIINLFEALKDYLEDFTG